MHLAVKREVEEEGGKKERENNDLGQPRSTSKNGGCLDRFKPTLSHPRKRKSALSMSHRR
jgi:hypothetical protein